MKRFFCFCFCIISISLFSQSDLLKVGEKYWEDQLYIAISYNVLGSQPQSVNSAGFSYGVSAGYIKDIPFNRKGKWAVGVGAGYSFDSFSHNLKIEQTGIVTSAEGLTSNKIKLHSFEFPIQLRWRNSTAVKYSFWRFYTGVRLSYNFSNRFRYILNDKQYSFTNVPIYNKFQSAIELSVGYGSFNFYAYYSLAPMYKNALINNEKINTKILKFGLIFYIL